MAKSTNLSFTLPEPMLKEVIRACELEHRTRSELIREALRHYLHRIPSVAPTPSEIAALERGRAEHRRGEYVTLDQLKEELEHAVATDRRKGRTKKARKPQAVSC